GNVLGSRGSVVPLFKQQIERGGPLTVTHPEMTRFFMTIPEAVHLVLQAGGMASGELFVLNMGQPVRIVDLARDLIRLSGYEVGEIAIEYTGTRPGEKLDEALWDSDGATEPTEHPDILRVVEDRSVLTDAALATLEAAVASGDRMEIAVALAQAVPAFVPFGCRERV
ncbi:MAG: polysaccharide biosynthesis protein, partial [Bacteroidales bacterium]